MRIVVVMLAVVAVMIACEDILVPPLSFRADTLSPVQGAVKPHRYQGLSGTLGFAIALWFTPLGPPIEMGG